jgi:hypothetical protein
VAGELVGQRVQALGHLLAAQRLAPLDLEQFHAAMLAAGAAAREGAGT